MHELLSDYEVELRFRGYAETTITIYRREVQHLLDHASGPPATVSAQDALAYLEDRRGGFRSNRWNQTAAALQLFFRHVLLEDLELPTRPRRRRTQSRADLLLPVEEIHAALDRAEDPVTAAIGATAGLAGFRVRDLVALRPRQIQWKNGLIECPDRGRAVPIHGQGMGYLKAQRRDTGPTHWLFPSREGAHLSERAAQRRMQLLSDLIGRTVTLSLLRDSWIRNELERHAEEDVRSLMAALAGATSHTGQTMVMERLGA